jgi:hypothetical protein
MNRKGGAMIEAALVLPLVILSIFAIIGILMFLFEEAAAQADLHGGIRFDAGKQTGTYHGWTRSQKVVAERGFRGVYPVVEGTSSVVFEGAKILPGPVKKPLQAHIYIVDERKYIRYVDFFSRLTDEVTDEKEVEDSSGD